MVFTSLGHFWALRWAKKAQKGRILKLPKFDFYRLKCVCRHPRTHSAWFLGRKSQKSGREAMHPSEKMDLRKCGCIFSTFEKMVLWVF